MMLCIHETYSSRIGSLRIVLQHSRQAEIWDFTLQFAIDQNIASGEVPMNVVHVWEVLHSCRYAVEHSHKLVRGKVPIMVLWGRKKQISDQCYNLAEVFRLNINICWQEHTFKYWSRAPFSMYSVIIMASLTETIDRRERPVKTCTVLWNGILKYWKLLFDRMILTFGDNTL